MEHETNCSRNDKIQFEFKMQKYLKEWKFLHANDKQ